MPLIGFIPALLVAFASPQVSAATEPPALRLRQDLLRPDDGADLVTRGAAADLRLRLQASFDCGDPGAAAGLFVSVADTSVSTSQAKSPQAVLITIPHSQLRGVRDSLACPGTGQHLFRGQLTAFATLTCRAEDGAEVAATVSQPLDLWVDCGEDEIEPPEPPPQRVD